jgi:hypothetical protein
MPRWWTQINKRVFNPAELRRGVRPVLTHVGRSSGRVYRTPLDAHPVEGGYVFVLAAGGARLTVDGRDIELASPRLVTEHEAWAAIGDDVKRPPSVLRINEFLRMDLATA